MRRVTHVPVDRHRTKVLNAGRATHHIARDEEVAEEGSERPLSQIIVDDRQGHDQQGDRDVGNRQTGQTKKKKLKNALLTKKNIEFHLKSV